MPDLTPAELLQAAADKLALTPALIQRTEAGATEDITEPLAALLRHAAEYARLPMTVTVNGEDAASVVLRRELAVARAILGGDA